MQYSDFGAYMQWLQVLHSWDLYILCAVWSGGRRGPFESITGLVGARARWMRGVPGWPGCSRYRVRGPGCSWVLLGPGGMGRAWAVLACVRVCTCGVRCWAVGGRRVLVWACWWGAAVAVAPVCCPTLPNPKHFQRFAGGGGPLRAGVWFISYLPLTLYRYFFNHLRLVGTDISTVV